jgi:hypothetical protein
MGSSFLVTIRKALLLQYSHTGKKKEAIVVWGTVSTVVTSSSRKS